jgi:hypothetical protein
MNDVDLTATVNLAKRFGPGDVVDLSSKPLWEGYTFEGCRLIGRSKCRNCGFIGVTGNFEIIGELVAKLNLSNMVEELHATEAEGRSPHGLNTVKGQRS